MIWSQISDVKLAMDRASPRVVMLLSLFVVAAVGFGDNATQNSANAFVAPETGRNSGEDFHLSLQSLFVHKVQRVFPPRKQY